ncbi:haloacid dehalogenase [Hymenopellis radicata]|nr:haloacid dehalogenase [Hymenopellis radicata]
MDGVEAVLFDVFGTVVDWHGSVVEELKRLPVSDAAINPDWQSAFATEWRKGYLENTARIAKGTNEEGPRSVDELHRQILDSMLSSPRWSQIGSSLDEAQRADLNLVWHRLHGWPDSAPGLNALKRHVLICSLSNGNVRLLADMAKFASLPWDIVFSAEMFASYKPNPAVYLGAMHHLSLDGKPEKCVMAAAHIWDLEAAAKLGMKTVYIPRPGEDKQLEFTVKTKDEGGFVDAIVHSISELAELFTAQA